MSHKSNISLKCNCWRLVGSRKLREYFEEISKFSIQFHYLWPNDRGALFCLTGFLENQGFCILVLPFYSHLHPYHTHLNSLCTYLGSFPHIYKLILQYTFGMKLRQVIAFQWILLIVQFSYTLLHVAKYTSSGLVTGLGKRNIHMGLTQVWDNFDYFERKKNLAKFLF